MAERARLRFQRENAPPEAAAISPRGVGRGGEEQEEALNSACRRRRRRRGRRSR
jgi:hypothetical protein